MWLMQQFILIFVGGNDVVLGRKLRGLVVPGGDGRLGRSGSLVRRAKLQSVFLVHLLQQGPQDYSHLLNVYLVRCHARLDVV